MLIFGIVCFVVVAGGLLAIVLVLIKRMEDETKRDLLRQIDEAESASRQERYYRVNEIARSMRDENHE